MRYILYLFTLALVFVGGMLVGNIYLPERNSSVAAAISVPDAQSAHPAIAAATLDVAQRNLRILNDALNSCPVVVGEEKERLIHQIDLFWARQDFDLKKARYELEIAKNTPGTAVTSRFAQASADYSAALKRVEKMAQDYFPQPQEEKVAEKPAKQAEILAKPTETPAKNIAPAKTAAPKQAAEKAPAKKAPQEQAVATQTALPAEPKAAPAETPQDAVLQNTEQATAETAKAVPTNSTVEPQAETSAEPLSDAPTAKTAQESVATETAATPKLKTAAVNAPKAAEKPQTATAQETEQVKAETDKAPLANSTPETPAETAPQASDETTAQNTIAAQQENTPQTAETATRQENANQAAETTAQAQDATTPQTQDSTAPQAQPTEPKN